MTLGDLLPFTLALLIAASVLGPVVAREWRRRREYDRRFWFDTVTKQRCRSCGAVRGAWQRCACRRAA